MQLSKILFSLLIVSTLFFHHHQANALTIDWAKLNLKQLSLPHRLPSTIRKPMKLRSPNEVKKNKEICNTAQKECFSELVDKYYSNLENLFTDESYISPLEVNECAKETFSQCVTHPLCKKNTQVPFTYEVSLWNDQEFNFDLSCTKTTEESQEDSKASMEVACNPENFWGVHESHFKAGEMATTFFCNDDQQISGMEFDIWAKINKKNETDYAARFSKFKDVKNYLECVIADVDGNANSISIFTNSGFGFVDFPKEACYPTEEFGLTGYQIRLLSISAPDPTKFSPDAYCSLEFKVIPK